MRWMSNMQPSKSLFAVPVDEERNTRYLETRHKAVELFARHGFSRVSMRDLATGLGITAGSLYNHIDNKEALLFELIEELYEALLDGARLVTRRKSAPTARLHGLLEAHLRLHERMAAHFRLAEYDLHCLSCEQQALILTLRGRYEEHLVEAIEQLTGQPAGATLRATMNGIVSLLNQLPAWVGKPQAGIGARRKLLHEMVMSTLQGALRATQAADPTRPERPPLQRL
ncbi:TetR/AcrR family transcriptional regulator [Pseudomonas sp. UW4]|uniref:TetR/AcrR family transcriptional regulator n=1 Tax=Pseudomonas sp. UW4 TaxID=1207075 RepID=UPI00029CEC95|nr:TetR/AcrR family transcriptional regulator [Pseudomonas sp. UW4]AFY19424.1 TetR family transcriptioanl regulator [Pseudomonas sp. UW4]